MLSGSEYQQDLRRQLETIQQEAGVLRDKLVELERENEQLVAESKRHDLSRGRAPLAKNVSVPKINADDAVSQNIELQGEFDFMHSHDPKVNITTSIFKYRGSFPL